VAPSQAQKHVTVNETFRRLDALVQGVVLSRTTTAEPGSPAEGDAYILPSGASGTVWSSYAEHDLVAYQDGAWARIAPFEGLRLWVSDDDEFVAFDGAAWGAITGGSPETAAKFGVNTIADATNKLAVKSDAVLFNHDDVTPGSGDCQVKINKDTAGDTGALLFQTGASGRAEFGLAGDDDFHVKVSADGAAWTEALIIDKDNGYVGLLGAPAAHLHIHDTDAALRLEDTAGSHLQLSDESASQAVISKTAASGQALIDFVPDPQDGTSNALFRFFRTTNTTGVARFDIHVGNNTAARNCSFAGNDDCFVCDASGDFGVGVNSPGAKLDIQGGGVLVGAPAGGDKGAGAINAEAVYDNNALLSCYVFDQFIDGVIDQAKWDARAPDRHVRATFEDIEDSETGLVSQREKTPARLEPRLHAPMRKFAARVGTPYDPLTLDGYAQHWKDKRHLSAMPNETEFDPVNGQLTTGEWIQRLVETAEIQAVLIEELNARVKALSPKGQQ